jgi:Zn-finger protein
MVISCSDCVMQHTAACGECVVTHVLDREAEAVVFDLATERAIRLLAKAGMIPASRFRSA